MTESERKMTQLLNVDRSVMTEISEWNQFDFDSLQGYIRNQFRNSELQNIEKAVRGYICSLMSSEGQEKHMLEHFLFCYLRTITEESQRFGVSLERFAGYVPAVSALLQADTARCIEASLQLTDQVLKHISVRRTSESNHLLNMAKDFIREQLGNSTLNLEAVSDHVGLSRVYFCKLFHQMEGISFNAYLKKARIEEAKHLLLTTSMKVFEISNAVGFSHAKYFGAVFKEAVGQTPVEFQKSTHE